MFCRCPSGYSYILADEQANDGLVEEKVVFYNGCEGQDICKFKVNVEKQVAQVSGFKKDDKFLAIDSWLADDDNLPSLAKKQ